VAMAETAISRHSIAVLLHNAVYVMGHHIYSVMHKHGKQKTQRVSANIQRKVPAFLRYPIPT